MKRSHLTTIFGAGLAGAALLLTTACGAAVETAPAQNETAPVVTFHDETRPVAANPAKAKPYQVVPVAYQAQLRVTDLVTKTLSPQAGGHTFETSLNEATHAANLRRGPGFDFEVIATVNKDDAILVTGRAAGSNWLQAEVQGQTGWLAGELIAGQALIAGLPVVDTGHLTPAPAVEIDLIEASLDEVSEAEQEAEIIAQLRAAGCEDTPVRGFGATWHNHPEVRPLLGCPFTDWRRDEHATAAAVQTFQGGWMLWLETDTVANVDPIYVFFADDGSYLRFGDRPLADAHAYGPTPNGFYKIGDRFTKIYWENLWPEERGRLGLATGEARDSQGAFQEFENGRMFWAGEADTIYVIYAGDYDLDGDGEHTWQQGWLSYEDTFEAPAE